MSSEIPSTMRAVALAAYGKPATYDLATLPTPAISKPDEILIKVHAAAINPIDVKMASGLGKLMVTAKFPYKIGYDVSGVIVAVGSSVTTLKPGDEVYSRVPEEYRGTVADYVLSNLSATSLKPSSLSFSSSAAIPLAALTALQSLQKAEAYFGGAGSLVGKTVFVPAGLSGTGSFAVQLAKHVFGAGKVITTLSASKIARMEELLGEGTVDQIVDYTTADVVSSIGHGTVDFLFDTVGGTRAYLPVLKHGGFIVSVSTVPSGKLTATIMPEISVVLKWVLDAVDWFYSWSAGRYGVNYTYLFMHPDAKDLEDLSRWVGEGKVRPIVGRTAKLEDLSEVRAGCQQVFDAKGGIGKFVIEM